MIDIPEIPLEEFEVPKETEVSDAGIKNEYTGALDFGVLGCGQAGCRLAKSFYDIGYKKVVALNTASADLNPLQIPDNQKLKIGSFEGSGKDMAKGQQAATESSQAIFDNLKSVFGIVDKIVVCVGAGGGTGAGSLSVLISICNKYLDFIGHTVPAKDIITVIALPTAGELRSTIVKNNNESILKFLSNVIDTDEVGPIFLVDNAKIEKLYRGISPTKFWTTINDTITNLFQGFNYFSKQESTYSSFDEEDYKTVLSVPGIACFGVTKIEYNPEVRLSQVLQDNLKKTLLSDLPDFGSAKECSCILAINAEIMETISMDYVNYGFDNISNLIGTANVHRGLYDTEKDNIRAYTLITGMKFKEQNG